jgi:5-methyltetrahydropteroyltriglutamate--homocysteine methyltransferase
MIRTPRTPARAETVGSLLRPAPLKRAVENFYAVGHSAALEEEREQDHTDLRAAEDRAIREAVQRQIDCGLDVVTDGEFRRWMFMNSFYDAVSGVRTGKTVASASN